jgi:hypothetical protein
VVKASRAHSSGIEGVPFVSAVTRPSVFFARRPTTFGAPEAWTGGVEAVLLIEFTINNDSDLFVREGAHALIL